MNQKIAWIRSGDGTINIFCNGTPFTVALDFPTYVAIDKALKENRLDEQKMYTLLDIKKTIPAIAKRVSQGRVRVDLDAKKVWFDEVEFPDQGLCDRILNLMTEGQPFEYMINFLERLGANPSFRSVMQLFSFITHKGFPITPEGKFLAYKGINPDYTDKYTGQIDNSIGRVVEMKRDAVCQDFHQACAAGLHAGTYGYARNYIGSNGRLVLVEIDPADVVSVPSHDVEKLRCCRYRVVRDHTGTILTGEVYDSTGKRVEANTFGQFDNDTAAHWDQDEGRTYGNVPERDDEDWEEDAGYDDYDADDYEDGAWS